MTKADKINRTVDGVLGTTTNFSAFLSFSIRRGYTTKQNSKKWNFLTDCISELGKRENVKYE